MRFFFNENFRFIQFYFGTKMNILISNSKPPRQDGYDWISSCWKYLKCTLYSYPIGILKCKPQNSNVGIQCSSSMIFPILLVLISLFICYSKEYRYSTSIICSWDGAITNLVETSFTRCFFATLRQLKSKKLTLCCIAIMFSLCMKSHLVAQRKVVLFDCRIVSNMTF